MRFNQTAVTIFSGGRVQRQMAEATLSRHLRNGRACAKQASWRKLIKVDLPYNNGSLIFTSAPSVDNPGLKKPCCIFSGFVLRLAGHLLIKLV